tara:strand:+ start:5983 stop:6162 length:180 start_codon:yes stop_codon:yes gene_type:complete
MDTEYMKKDLTKSPKKKSEDVLPEGWQINLIRGVWKVRDAQGVLTIYTTEQEAWEYING